jgi:hypothetical protein
VSRNGVRVGDILHNFDQKYAAAKANNSEKQGLCQGVGADTLPKN